MREAATNTLRVGIAGLGLMGGAIAANILRKGFRLNVLAHRSRDTVERLVAEGAHEVSTARELAASSDVVITVVTGTAQARDLVFRPDGLRAGAHAGLVMVESSTCDPELAEEITRALAPAGASFLDAPVNRTPKEAEQGRLNVLVGGSADALQRVRPVLETYSETIHHLGGPGSGYRAKLIHNFVAQANAAVLAEAIGAAAKVGLDLSEFVALCRLSGAHSKSFDRLVPYLLTGDDSGQKFALRNAAKDMWSYARLAAGASATAIIAESVRQTYVLATNLGHGDKFMPRLFDVMSQLNGTGPSLATARTEA